ncbi:AMP-binding protein [Salinispora arenicola]|uniref:AMP-binding protein n=1 Tax=Salinispora arenicola TaxID=168697 RepID=UPI0027DB0184|nr:AMP-binding protein [Salinispora arenicola]
MTWFARHGRTGPGVLNAYGPTEATVWVCGHSITAAEATAADAPSLIGIPLPDTGMCLLDDARGGWCRSVRPGTMFLAGPGVAAGYLDRPELTTARFTADPFAPDARARMYDSGDRARLRGDGELEYLGRADEQVKVRGFRVEPGEVAGRLREHPDVGSMVVTVRTENGEERLVAYVVPTAGRGEGDGSRVDPDGLRQFCAETLPGYMVPAVRLIDRIPLTPNGKVDHEVLPAAGLWRRPDGPTSSRATTPSGAWRSWSPTCCRCPPSASRTTSSTPACTRWWPPGW